MATRVGVRDLKQDAPRLVKRAAQGERIIITNRGAPVAVLAPLAASDAVESHPSLAAWQEERRAFERMAPRLEKTHRGRYVAVAGGDIVDADEDYDVLRRRLVAKLGERVYFVARVGEPSPLVDMPGFELE